MTELKNPDLKEIPAGFKVSVDHWFMDQHFAWDKARIEGDKVVLSELMVSAIIETPFSNFDCKNASDYTSKLKPLQWKNCAIAVSNAAHNCFLG